MNKIYKGCLILDWKKNSMRIVKKKPKDMGPFELPLNLEINVKIPDTETKKLSTEIEIPETKVSEMIAHQV